MVSKLFHNNLILLGYENNLVPIDADIRIGLTNATNIKVTFQVDFVQHASATIPKAIELKNHGVTLQG